MSSILLSTLNTAPEWVLCWRDDGNTKRAEMLVSEQLSSYDHSVEWRGGLQRNQLLLQSTVAQAEDYTVNKNIVWCAVLSSNQQRGIQSDFVLLIANSCKHFLTSLILLVLLWLFWTGPLHAATLGHAKWPLAYAVKARNSATPSDRRVRHSWQATLNALTANSTR